MSDLMAERAALLRQVAELQAEVARLQAAMAVPNGVTNQDWGSLDGAVAWHLIDRHAETWADIGRQMDLWLAARSAAAVAALQSEVEALRAQVEWLSKAADKLLAHCPDAECATCAKAMCPLGDGFHYHHDGCPSCSAINPARKEG